MYEPDFGAHYRVNYRAQRAKNHNLCFSIADGEAYADAKAVHAVNQKLQPLRSVGDDNSNIDIAQGRHTGVRAQHQARPELSRFTYIRRTPCGKFSD